MQQNGAPHMPHTRPLPEACLSAQADALAEEIAVPVLQARRCLDQWLAEETRYLPERQRRRAAALIARYFLYEDNVTDDLLMSFLRHYAGFRVIDMEDPASVRAELKAVLDASVVREPSPSSIFSARHYFLAAAVFGCLLLGVLLWLRPSPPINMVQERALKARVEKLTALDPSLRAVTVWARVRSPFGVSRYRELTRAQYDDAKAMLDGWIAELQAAPASPATLGTRM